MTCIGIRREDKNEWERRVPLIPNDLKALISETGVEVIVQPSPIRIFPDHTFVAAGAKVAEDLSPCSLVFAVKEVPVPMLKPKTAYMFFSHTIKGQKYNMPMLKRMMDLECTLIDYEKVMDAAGRRLIFFGRHAGMAGMIESLWALGRRLDWEGIPSPFSGLKRALNYSSVQAARAGLETAAAHIAAGLGKQLAPLVVGFAGYGNVSKGAQQIFDLLPHLELAPDVMVERFEAGTLPTDRLVKVVFKEEHFVEPLEPDRPFVLTDYFQHPEHYRGRFSRYLPYLTVLMNGIYWDQRYPRLVTKDELTALFADPGAKPRLRVIGDIGCDLEGAVEATLRITNPGDPVFVYHPDTRAATDGLEGPGVVILAVDTLPSEIPLEASTDFSHVLKPLVKPLIQADYSAPFESLDLPPELKNAVILYHGRLTPTYQYMAAYVEHLT